jgi:dienelactone hydrolase
MPIKTETSAYRDDGTQLTGMLAWSDATHMKRPGVLVIHGGAGLDDHARGRARRLAEHGLVTFACDMYGDGIAGDRERVMARIKELREEPGKLCRRALAGLDLLASHPLVDGRLAAIGYCFGGMTVLELARQGAELSGVASVHGSLSTANTAVQGAVKAKILVCHGALDPHVPAAHVNAFVEEMNAAQADWQLIVYGRALHGFTHENAPAIPGVAYDAIADARSSVAILGFFRELFGPSQIPANYS